MSRRIRRAWFVIHLITILAVILFSTLVPFGVTFAQDKPKYGGTLIAGADGEPSTLNLDISYSYNAILAVSGVFNHLTKLDYDLNPRPDLAESWKISEDGLTYTFNLVKNATWHDGKPFTSQDVKFTFEEIIKKHSPRGSLVLQAVESIETP